MRAMQKVLGAHALQHERRGGLVVDVVGQCHDLLRGECAHVDVGTRRRACIGDAIARKQVGDAFADIDDDASSLHARRRGRLDHAVLAAAHVHVDVVDADRGVANAHFAATG
jgi:hypothetical protein